MNYKGRIMKLNSQLSRLRRSFGGQATIPPSLELRRAGNYKLRRSCNEKGITSLVEIMIIVVVLGILVAASIANFTGARDRAKLRASASALQEVTRAIEGYWIEKDTYPIFSCVDDPISTCFTRLYTILSPFYDAERISQHCTYVSYTSTVNFYTFVVRAKNVPRTILTATPRGITAIDGNIDYSKLVN